jgi:hypothetical protein
MALSESVQESLNEASASLRNAARRSETWQ